MAADTAAQPWADISPVLLSGEEFLQNVVESFTRVYQQGGTPNPPSSATGR